VSRHRCSRPHSSVPSWCPCQRRGLVGVVSIVSWAAVGHQHSRYLEARTKRPAIVAVYGDGSGGDRKNDRLSGLGRWAIRSAEVDERAMRRFRARVSSLGTQSPQHADASALAGGPLMPAPISPTVPSHIFTPPLHLQSNQFAAVHAACPSLQAGNRMFAARSSANELARNA
jgi:hypothetical protein